MVYWLLAVCRRGRLPTVSSEVFLRQAARLDGGGPRWSLYFFLARI
jgi:hypothetical protein